MFQSITTCWPLLCLNAERKNKLVTSSRGVCTTWSQCMPGRVFYTSCAGKHGGQYKTNFRSLKPVLAFQTLMLATLGKWATTHERAFFLGKNCSWTLLPGSTWLQTPITRFYRQLRSKLQNTFCFFKTCWWLTGLSRLYDASQPPGSYTRYFKTMLQISVDRALMHHISFSLMVFRLTLDRFTCRVSRHNSRCKQSVPRLSLYILWDLILTSYTINSLSLSCSTNKHLKICLGKAKCFCIRYFSKMKSDPATKLQSNVSQVKQSPLAKIQNLSRKFFFYPNRHLALFCTHPFNKALCTHRRPMIAEAKALCTHRRPMIAEAWRGECKTVLSDDLGKKKNFRERVWILAGGLRFTQETLLWSFSRWVALHFREITYAKRRTGWENRVLFCIRNISKTKRT